MLGKPVDTRSRDIRSIVVVVVFVGGLFLVNSMKASLELHLRCSILGWFERLSDLLEFTVFLDNVSIIIVVVVAVVPIESEGHFSGPGRAHVVACRTTRGLL